ncbi:hypothetical protein DACRYDRAFT_21481 [Dacryopinax primogenitus]|uniref:Uncharacterized protein n=1 Tax=Dacryopinax primogenitus (strain DJM 731) TaxID=1858805 RepID=M5G3H4_DACPD|nr:uncharacterized protein DACRYDRAFT_21481 [Dacryopinax primogenitus]EJU03224.1 hypothetical protein DACRYDRAFT_21481 [Dacryopinax primogenitus]
MPVGLGINLSGPNGTMTSLPAADSNATIRPRKRNSLIDVLPRRSATKSSSSRSNGSNPPTPSVAVRNSPAQAQAVLSTMDPDPKMTAALTEIRKGRADVKQRYETRMAFLRAKLKGAELHEKLIK